MARDPELTRSEDELAHEEPTGAPRTPRPSERSQEALSQERSRGDGTVERETLGETADARERGARPDDVDREAYTGEAGTEGVK